MPNETKPTFQVLINADERTALIDLINIALKAGGLNVAQNAIFLALKIQNSPEFQSPLADNVKELPKA